MGKTNVWILVGFSLVVATALSGCESDFCLGSRGSDRPTVPPPPVPAVAATNPFVQPAQASAAPGTPPPPPADAGAPSGLTPQGSVSSSAPTASPMPPSSPYNMITPPAAPTPSVIRQSN